MPLTDLAALDAGELQTDPFDYIVVSDFLRTDWSWHGHKPFVGERRMLQYNFLSDRKLALLSQKLSRMGTHFGKRVLGLGH